MRKTLLAAIAFTLLGATAFAQGSIVSTVPTTVSISTSVFTTSTKVDVKRDKLKDGLKDALQSVCKVYRTNLIEGGAYRYHLVAKRGVVKYDLICWSKDKTKIDNSKLIVSTAYRSNSEIGFEYAPLFKYFDKGANAKCETFRRAGSGFMEEYESNKRIKKCYRGDLHNALLILGLHNSSK
ncbi:MAG: hypothetical protein U9R08_04350 [Nanoarchaeota archaeon]|nr:hypothetical protein [Nanoarchaeota archaeon]